MENSIYLDKTVVAFGVGKVMQAYIERLHPECRISYFADNNPQLWGTYPLNDGRPCISAKDILSLEKPFVVITADRESSIESIKEQLNSMKVPNCHVMDLIEERQELGNTHNWIHSIQPGRLKKFIDISLRETNKCNFTCDYCYIGQNNGFHGKTLTSMHSPKEIRQALSQKRLGGVCFFNFCARGETLLSDDIVEIVHELLSEGHYVSIVTNGTVTKKIKEILNFPHDLQSRLFFKLSFHYVELKKRKMIKHFFDNVKEIKQSSCSYTLEITPYDELIPYIDEIKDIFDQYEKGCLPHVTVARDVTTPDYHVLTKYSMEDYNKLWGQFSSKMFDLKNKWYGIQNNRYCYAGNWSYLLDLYSGDYKSCYRFAPLGNIFDDISVPLSVVPVGFGCKMPYCFNNHAFYAFGCVPDIKCDSYLDMRNHQDINGDFWVKKEMADFMNQKLYQNNYRFDQDNSEFEGIFDRKRKPAYILFNSPDYSNVGDHAIALAERMYLERFFPESKVIEVTHKAYLSCDLKTFIKNEDVLLITGGGYLGELWISYEDVVRDIIQSFPDNKIIILPQTVYFGDSHLGYLEFEVSKRIYNAHQKLTVCAREENSMKAMEALLDSHVKRLSLPDMALLLDYSKERYRRDGVLICLREDKESILSASEKKRIKTILTECEIDCKEISMLESKNISIKQRKSVVEDKILQLKGAEAVVTDRLHCMVLCAVSGTPCVALNNQSGKVFGVYQWIESLPYIKVAVKVEEIPDKLKFVRTQTSQAYPVESILSKFDGLREILEMK